MEYTLASLQARRSAAMESGDMPAYWAFDLLIGHVLGESAMYARQNKALDAAMPDYVEDVFGVHEEQRKHPIMEHMLKLVLAQSTATIGAVMRAWLWVMAFTAVPSFAMMYHDLKPVHGAVEAVSRAFPASIIMGCLFSIPVMAVLAVIHIARKW